MTVDVVHTTIEQDLRLGDQVFGRHSMFERSGVLERKGRKGGGWRDERLGRFGRKRRGKDGAIRVADDLLRFEVGGWVDPLRRELGVLFAAWALDVGLLFGSFPRPLIVSGVAGPGAFQLRGRRNAT